MIWYLGSEPLQKNQECAVPLGVQGEDNAKQYTANVADWLAAFPLGIIVLVLQPPDGSAPYMADTSTDAANGIVTWNVTEFDTAQPGYGKGELRLVSENAIVKSYTFKTYTKSSVLMCASNPPAPVPEWAAELLEAASGLNIAVEAAEQAGQAAIVAEGAAAEAAMSAGTAQAAAATAGEYANNSQESAKESQKYAQLSEMSAESHGFFEMQINDQGHLLYICTESFDDITFELHEGRLIASYGS